MEKEVTIQKLNTGIATSTKWVIMLIYFGITLFPLIWLTVSSFKTNFQIQTAPFAFPEEWQFQNFINAVSISGLSRYYLNSAIIAFSSTLINIFVASLASFALAREDFPFKKAVFTIVTAGVLVPSMALMVPYYILVTRILMIYDTLFGLIITYAAINIPISVFIISSFMKSIPKELEDSAEIDGCSMVKRYSKIILPLAQPGLVTASVFNFIHSWNEFIYALLLTSSRSSRTVQVAIRYFTSQFRTDYASMFAAIVLTMIPTILLYIFLHEKIISGVTAGAVKG